MSRHSWGLEQIRHFYFWHKVWSGLLLLSLSMIKLFVFDLGHSVTLLLYHTFLLARYSKYVQWMLIVLWFVGELNCLEQGLIIHQWWNKIWIGWLLYYYSGFNIWCNQTMYKECSSDGYVYTDKVWCVYWHLATIIKVG